MTKKKTGAPKQERILIPESVGKDELSDFFGLSKRQIERWEEDGLPKNTDGPRNMYNLKDVFDWRYGKIQEKNLTELDLEKLRETKAKADKIELEVNEKKANLLPLQPILAIWNQNTVNAKTSFRGLVSDIKIYDPAVSQKTLDYLKNRVWEILNELGAADAIPTELQKIIQRYDADVDTSARSEDVGVG